MSSKIIMNINDVNLLSDDTFQQLFSNIIEHNGTAANIVAKKRPFNSVDRLKKAFIEFLETLDGSDRESVLSNYPDLAGRLAEQGKLTQQSQNEHRCAGLDVISKDEKQILTKYNSLYREKFQFPFVICARLNRVQSILSGLETRLKNSRDTELETGIEEVKKICLLRIDDLVCPICKL